MLSLPALAQRLRRHRHHGQEDPTTPPQTNGKIERYHRTLLEECAYIRAWTSDTERTTGYTGFTHFYNHHRPHGALNWPTAATLTACHGDNLPAEHT